MPEPEGEVGEPGLPDLPDLENEQGNLLGGIDNKTIKNRKFPFVYICSLLIQLQWNKMVQNYNKTLLKSLFFWKNNVFIQ